MSQKNDRTSENSAPLFGECPKPVTRRKFMGGGELKVSGTIFWEKQLYFLFPLTQQQ